MITYYIILCNLNHRVHQSFSKHCNLLNGKLYSILNIQLQRQCYYYYYYVIGPNIPTFMMFPLRILISWFCLIRIIWLCFDIYIYTFLFRIVVLFSIVFKLHAMSPRCQSPSSAYSINSGLCLGNFLDQIALIVPSTSDTIILLYRYYYCGQNIVIYNFPLQWHNNVFTRTMIIFHILYYYYSQVKVPRNINIIIYRRLASAFV